MKRLTEEIFQRRRRISIFFLSLFIFSVLISILPIKIVGLNSANEDKLVLIEVLPGSGLLEIASKLEKGAVISSEIKFATFALLSGQGSKLKSGNYVLSEKMAYFDALDRLVKGPKISDKKLYTVIIPEGFTAKQVAARVATKMGLSLKTLEDIFLEGAGLGRNIPSSLAERPIASLEGYLFPKTYLFSEDDDEVAVTRKMLLQFEDELAAIKLKKVMGKDYSLHEIITIASLIEKEVKVASERGLVSATIFNRLKRGMPLQIDATIQYVLTERKESLNLTDLKVDSPYNTYANAGLPPGPICNPGIDSIKAALNPAKVDYLYYVLTGADGSHTFTSTYKDFQAAKAEAKRNGR